MEVSHSLSSQLQSLQSATSYGLMKKVMNMSGEMAQQLLDTMPSAEDMRAMELSVNPAVGTQIDERA